jgi:undecaprenyl-diphosphatase
MKYYFILAIGLLVLFIILSLAISPDINPTGSPLINADKSVFTILNKSHIPALNQFMVHLTQFGREYFWIPVLILLFAFGGWTGKKTSIIMAISFLVLIPLVSVVKDVIHRDRPIILNESFILKSDSESSFPSGHAVIVSAGAINTLMLFRGTFKKNIISICLTIEASLVCFSRVYVGGHYPLDVVGGIILGVAISLIFIGIYRHVESKVTNVFQFLKPINNKQRKPKGKITKR